MTLLHCPTCGKLRDLAFAGVTRREGEVIAAIRQGLVNKAIARQLGISENTVKVHVRAIMNKLDVRTRTAIAMTHLEDLP